MMSSAADTAETSETPAHARLAFEPPQAVQQVGIERLGRRAVPEHRQDRPVLPVLEQEGETAVTRPTKREACSTVFVPVSS
jgi:hypothetical protein